MSLVAVRKFAIVLCFGMPTQMALADTDSSWPTFRGSDRTAVAPDTDLLESWPKSGPQLLWETPGAGRGYASLAIAGGKIYTLGDGLSTAEDKMEYLTCYDQATGKQLWMLKTGKPWNQGTESWQSSRSTPTVDGERVYVITPFGVLVCASTKGEMLWQKDLNEAFGGKKADSWGYSESVLIIGDRLFCTPGGEKATMVALNKSNGEAIWTCPRKGDAGAGHASIVPSTIDGRTVLVQTTGSGAMGVSETDGKLLWTYDIDKTTAVIPTPIVRDDLAFIAAGYGRGGALLRQAAKGNTVTVTEVYPLKKELANKHGGIVLVGDYLYGDSDDKGIPFCADLLTGEIKWKSRGSGRDSACVAAADGHIYIRYADGTMTLVEAKPSAFSEVSSFKIPDSDQRPSWSHPVIVDGKLYLRESDKLLCYDIEQMN